MAYVESKLTAFAVPDARLRTAGAASTIEETGGTTDYTQAGPTAPGAVDIGDGVTLGLSGNQTQDVYLNVKRGGAPDPARGARLTWADSSTDTLLGWAPPTWLTSIHGTTDLAAADVLDAITLNNGSVMVASADGDSGVTEVATYDPTDDTWTANTDLPWAATAATPQDAMLALWQDADDTVWVVMTDVSGASSVRRLLVKSTDLGTTWTTVAQLSFAGGTPTAAGRKCRWWVLPSGDHVLVILATNSIQTWRSTSGEDWQLVGEISGINDGASNAVPTADAQLLPDGRILYAYVLSASKETIRVRVSDPLQSPSTVAPLDVVTNSGFTNTLALVIEETGRAWILAEEASAGVRTYASIDYSTWVEDGGNRLFVNGDVNVIEPRRAVPVRGGHMLLVSNYTSTTASDPPLAQMLGGWTSIEPWSAAAGLSARDSDRVTFGSSATSDVPWLGITANQLDNLTTSSWGVTTSGTNGETTAADVRTITTTTGARAYTDSSGSYGDSVLALFDVRVVSGGSMANPEIAWSVRTNTTTNNSGIQCFLRGDRFRLFDYSGTQVAQVDVDLTERMQFFVCIESTNRVEVYYKRPYELAWTSAYQASSLATAALSGNGYVEFGNGGVDFGTGTGYLTGTGVSQWRAVAAVFATGSTASAKRDQWRSTGSLITARQAVLGRPASGYPGQLGDPDTYPAVKLLSVAPTTGTTATVAPRYSYGIDRLDPRAYPSPRDEWRSTDTTEHIIEWELDATYDTNDVRFYALGLLNTNVESAFLEYYTGSTWATLVEYSSGIAATYTLSGRTMTLGGSPRWIQQGEMDTGHAVIGTDYRLVSQTDAGDGGDVDARLLLDGIDGTESTSGNVTLVPPRGVAVSLTRQALRRVRLRIPAATTPEGYFRIGTLILGRVYVLGAAEDFGTTQTVLLDVQEQERPGYTLRTRRSPPRRRWVMSLSEASILGPRSGTADYYAPSGNTSLPLVYDGDASPLLEGLLYEGIDTVPILALPDCPEEQDGANDWTPTETRRDVLWWARSQGVAWDLVTGSIGVDELHRLGTWTLDEQV